MPESLFNKFRPQPGTLLKKRFRHRYFSANFTKFFRKLILQNTSGRQRLQIHVTVCSIYLLNDENYKKCFQTKCFDRLCLVRLIYFCRFADFKLQRNKVQSWKFSFAVMENFDTEFIALLLNEENTIEEVSLILQDMYPNKKDLSIRYLKCYFAKHGISKRILRNKLDNLVAEAVEEARFKSRHNKVY